MINCKNLCLLKAFDLSEDVIEAARNAAKEGVSVEISEEYRDFTLSVINYTADEVVFNGVVMALKTLLGKSLYSEDGETLEEVLVKELKECGKTFSVAESFTGGLISTRTVSVSGASGVFYEGLVTYGSSAKIRRLHVKVQTIEKYGIVSEEVAKEMTQGLLANRIADYALSTTGCAGPDTDEYDTPVGLCYVAIACAEGTLILELMIDGDRNYIRNTATNCALFNFIGVIRGNIAVGQTIKRKI